MKKINTRLTSILALTVVSCFWFPAHAQKSTGPANIADFGAAADGSTDSAEAFVKAWSSGAKKIVVPPGTFSVSNLVVPDGVIIEGSGDSSVLIPSAKTVSPLVRLGNSVRISDLKFSGNGSKVICLRSGKVNNVKIRDVTIDNFDNMAIETDRTQDMVIESCNISKVKRATNIQFSHRIKVLNNTATDCTQHGFQFWGNWKWERKDSSDLQFIGNYVRDGGAGGIWGCGAERVVMANNVVDGAKDVGLDLEWCDDSVITGNTVRRSKNAGISLFFACQRVSITGNTIRNDYPISEKDAAAKWWVRAGIWLTYPNRKTFPNDYGHKDISIMGNVISSTEGKRRAMWIGKDSDNVTLIGNTINGGTIWTGGEQGANDQPTVEVKGDTVLRTISQK